MVLMEQAKTKLMTELEFNNMGNIRIFKFISSIFNDIDLTKAFLLSEGFAKWEVNKIIYDIEYRKNYYAKTKN